MNTKTPIGRFLISIGIAMIDLSEDECNEVIDAVSLLIEDSDKVIWGEPHSEKVITSLEQIGIKAEWNNTDQLTYYSLL